MRIQKMSFSKYFIVSIFTIILLSKTGFAQVNMVEFGKNRVQFTKFKWNFYQSPNFNVHYTQNGLELAKFVTQAAEEELPFMEEFVEYGIQRRLNIVSITTLMITNNQTLELVLIFQMQEG